MNMNMNKLEKNVLRWGVLGVCVAILAACTAKKDAVLPPKPTSAEIIQPNLSNVSMGYRFQPTGSDAVYTVVAHQQLPNWQQQVFGASLGAFQKSCLKIAQQPQWQNVCRQASHLSTTDNASAQAFFERYFTAWQVSDKGNPQGTFTGYYEPVLYGNNSQTATARFPIYGIPRDLVSVSLPSHLRDKKGVVRISATGTNSGTISENGNYSANLSLFPITATSKTLKGRFVGNQFVPYYTRKEINGGALNGIAPILGYANDPVELFFLHIQGSGRLQLPSGQTIRLGFADKNEYPYVSIGRYMANQGYLPLAQTSMQGIKAWMAQNPHKLAEVLGQNPSYIFFRQLDGSPSEGPIGALGVPLSGEYSGAVDRRYITLGAPLFVATTHPDTQQSLTRLIMAQDTGSAIKGAVRVDYFWGYGDAAGQTAGKMKNAGQVWQLLPNGVMPEYRN